MAHIQNDDAFVTAYDTRTGKKLAEKIPRAHLKIFPHLSATPKVKAVEQPKPAPKPTENAKTDPEKK